MRWLSGLGVLLAGTAESSLADACTLIGNGHLMLGWSSRRLRDRSRRAATCPSSTVVFVEVAAADDTTPAGDLGYRIRVVGGTRPPFVLGELYDRVLFDQPLEVSIRGDDVDLDFELGIAAIDQSGNVGPETTVAIFDEGPGCNAGGTGTWSLLPVATLGLMLLRPRRR